MRNGTNFKWILRAVLVLCAACVVGGVAYWNYNEQLEYIDGNVLNLPYINQWNDEDLIDNPWKNASFHTGLMYRNLFLSDSSFENVTCDLAQSYQISSDGLSYTITLKDGIVWSDGVALTVEDVVFSIQAVLQSSTANGLYVTAFSKIEGYQDFIADPSEALSGIEVVNSNTICIHLTSAHPNMIQVLAQFVILPAHCFEDTNLQFIDADPYWKDPVVSGMYQVGEVVSYETVQLVRNEYYTEQAPNIDEILLHMNYKFANLDYYSTNNITEIINYRSIRSMSEYKVDLLFYRYFVFNVEGVDGNQNTAMQDDLVREAIALAIDRASLLDEVYLNSGTLIESGVPSTDEAYNGQTISYDPAQAIALLAESSYDLSRSLRLAYYYTDKTSKSFMEGVAEDLEAVGFTVELCPLSTQTELYQDREYDLLLKGLSAFDVSDWYAEYANENANIAQLFGGDTEFDALVEALSTTTDEAAQNEILKELQALEEEYLYKLPLFTLSQVLYINEDRVSLPQNCTFGNTWYTYDVDFENWSIKKE